jgi:putative chitinase
MVPFPVTPSIPQLSEHFSLAEATTSDTAARKGIDNSHPSADIIDNAIRTATKLEKVRALLGAPIHVNSWIRCKELNTLLGSRPTSQHTTGEAVDFIAPFYGSPLKICKLLIANNELIRWDQLILEHTWVHISWKATPNAVQRGEVLSLLSSNGYTVGLTDPAGKPY